MLRNGFIFLLIISLLSCNKNANYRNIIGSWTFKETLGLGVRTTNDHFILNLYPDSRYEILKNGISEISGNYHLGLDSTRKNIITLNPDHDDLSQLLLNKGNWFYSIDKNQLNIGLWPDWEARFLFEKIE